MRPWRYLPVLVLCCVLDLAVPVAPTTGAAEIEQDEVVQASMRPDARSGARAARPRARTLVAPHRGVTPGGDRRLARRRLLLAHVASREVPPAERRAAPPPLTEDD